MIRINKLTDYGLVVLTCVAESSNTQWHTARGLAHETGLPLPTVSKLLKIFSRGGLLSAQRGVNGGYNLTRSPESISVCDIIEIIDGPIAITDCVCHNGTNPCPIEGSCPTKPHWPEISGRIRNTLKEISLAELASPLLRLHGENR